MKTESPLPLEAFLAWLESKRSDLATLGIAIVSIRQRSGDLPAAAVDLSGSDVAGRINAWLTGEIDFEVVRISDGEDLYWAHRKVSSVQDLEGTFTDFVERLIDSIESQPSSPPEET